MIDDQSNSNGVVTVYDNMGRIILKDKIANSLGYIQMSNFDKGIYQIVVSLENGEIYSDRIILK
jgi:hypothetical protein